MTQIIDCPPSDRAPVTTDLTAVKARQQRMWAHGDFSVIGTTLQIVGETLCEAVDLEAGARVIDVACGNGNAALAASRRWCKVTGVDYVPALLRNAAARAEAERLPLDVVEGDAERLPFAEGHFDVALSTFGVMFAPNQERAASELMRVVRPGGTIGLASWTPDGFVGALLKTVAKRVPPQPGVASPVAWGVRVRIDELFRGAKSIRAAKRQFAFRYESAAHFVHVFRTYYGPTALAFDVLDARTQRLLAGEIADLALRFNRSEASLVVPADYLEVVIER
jgi:ubiquinone/menaquinone biosynthesis C-methylase UbiE